MGRYPPGSSVSEMSSSVLRLLRLAEGGAVRTALTGHNAVLCRAADVAEAAERHLEMAAAGATRKVRKAFSRARTRAVLEVNARFDVGDAARRWIMK